MVSEHLFIQKIFPTPHSRLWSHSEPAGSLIRLHPSVITPCPYSKNFTPEFHFTFYHHRNQGGIR